MRSRNVALIALSASLAVASWSAFAAPIYKLSAAISHQGKVFATPVMLVEDGKPSEISVHGEDGFTLALTVTAIDKDRLGVSADLQSSHGSMTPEMVVIAGQPATVSVGDVAIRVTVEPVERTRQR